MEDGGALGFSAENVEIGPEGSPSRAFVKPGRYVRYDIACTGVTLDPDTHVRMFEPFFTEKGVVRDGMGLAAVFGLVKQSGGFMWLEGERRGDTTFTILRRRGRRHHRAGSHGGATSVSAGTILVVDDDDAVRGLIVTILAHQGFTVLEAAGAETGLRLSRTRPVDLLITDAGTHVPGGGGWPRPCWGRVPTCAC
ncbi:MAG: hypothetical protein R2712_04890 [Vicinamibacterales bacterium]